MLQARVRGFVWGETRLCPAALTLRGNSILSGLSVSSLRGEPSSPTLWGSLDPDSVQKDGVTAVRMAKDPDEADGLRESSALLPGKTSRTFPDRNCATPSKVKGQSSAIWHTAEQRGRGSVSSRPRRFHLNSGRKGCGSSVLVRDTGGMQSWKMRGPAPSPGARVPLRAPHPTWGGGCTACSLGLPAQPPSPLIW